MKAKGVIRHQFAEHAAADPDGDRLGFADLRSQAVVTIKRPSPSSWTGLYSYRAASLWGFPAIMGVSLLASAVYLLTNPTVDILYGVIDPQAVYARETRSPCSISTTKLEAVMSERNPLLLEGKNALVTGAGGRIGSQIVAVMGREGASVAALDLTQKLADRGAGACPGKAIALTADVTSAGEADAAVAMAEDELGPLDILVNSHGIFPTVTLLDLTPEKWDNIFAVNVRGSMLMCQAAARRWIKRNSPGSIVNISSGAATSARAGGAAYCGSKAALNMMTKVLAIELGQHNIRVNVVAPGLILDSVLTRGATEAEPYVRAMLDAIPLGRTGHPREIAETVAFVSSDRSIWTTGAVFEVTGGSQAGRTHMPVADNLTADPADQSSTRELQTTRRTAWSNPERTA